MLAAQRALIDSLPDVIWIKDRDCRLSLVNRAFAERYGIPAAEAAGKTDFDIYPADKAARLREEDLKVMATRQPLRYESSQICDGLEFWVEVVKAPVFDDAGEVCGTVGTSRDISARKAAERTSEQVQQRLELALEGSGLVLWDVNLATGAAHLSEGWSRLLGLPDGETRTSIDALMALVHPDDLPAARECSLDCLRGKQDDYVSEHRVRTADGGWKWILSRGRVTARDPGGMAMRMTGTNLDITRRKQMEHSLRQALEQTETLLETTPTAIAVVRDGVINRCNAAMDRLFGFIGPAVRPMAALFPDTARWNTARTEIQEALARNHSFNGELELKHADGRRFWAAAAARPVQAGSAEILFALTDVTEQRQLARQLEAAKEAADAANRAKSGFLATMSHEIRTPMNGVLGMLELLELTELNREQRESLTLARGSAVSLLRLIDDILDFSKIEAGQLEIKPEPLSLATLAGRAVTVHQELALRKGLHLSCSVGSTLEAVHLGDGLRIAQILNNLLSNAIKFTEKGSVRLSVDKTGSSGNFDMVAIRVTDTGIGVTADQQQRLFQPFVQGDSETTRRFGGTGLGLSICRRLAELMGGSVELESTPGRGTSVTATLRLEIAGTATIREHHLKKSAPPPAIPAAGPAERPDAVILVVEDHPVNRMLLQRQVALLGYRSEIAEDGAEALEKLRSRRYDLVLTDCHMPNKDGYQLAREWRAIESAAGRPFLPVIACTANALPSDKTSCIEAGMSDYLPKPITLPALAEMIGRWLRQAAVPPPPAAPPAPCGDAAGVSLDPATLEPYTAGDDLLRQDILRQFSSANDADLAALRGALDPPDAEVLARTAHRIKGAARMIGALPLAAIAERMEREARGGRPDAAAALWCELDHESSRLASYIRHQTGGA